MPAQQQAQNVSHNTTTTQLMRKQKIFFIAIFCLTSFFATSQDFPKKLKDLKAKNDKVGQLKLLQSWETANSKDPDLIIAYFNYYVQKSSTEVISIDQNKKNDQSYQLSDTGTGKPVAYLNSSTKYNSQILQKGFDYINKGITLYPTRLDMRFGKIYMLGQAENYSEFTKEIVEAIDYGNKIKNAWTWQEGKPLEDAEAFFLGSIQDYVGTLFNTENDNLLPNMRQISSEVLKYKPDHVESLANVAMTYLIVGNYDQALPYLLKAETFAPNDIVVLNNIAETYKRKKDNSKAKLYYEKIIKVGNKSDIENAKNNIQKLDK
jgi:tetratricopeptide (TPR) repeat protein